MYTKNQPDGVLFGIVGDVLLLIIATMLLVKLLERKFFPVLANACGSSVPALNWTYRVEVRREYKRKLPKRSAAKGIFRCAVESCLPLALP